tara:strand:- start:101 stop:220 length:120 start_codon:yes stop_codon:yes gene_type:complete
MADVRTSAINFAKVTFSDMKFNIRYINIEEINGFNKATE